MALMKCKECGGSVSSHASACPHCGAKVPKGMSRLQILIGGGFAIAVAAAVFGPKSEAPAGKTESPEQVTAKKKATDQADREINLVLAGARRLKEAMKKPETFELISATMMDGKVICYEYRARNSFNDRRTEQYVLGDKISSNKVADWNKHCAGKSGTDYSSVRAVM